MDNKKTTDYDQPVAYDKDGRPLYAHPPKNDNTANQKSVHVSRPIDPDAPTVSEATRKKHEESVAAYPRLNLSEGEYIISAVRRHPIGLLIPIATGGAVALAVLAGLAYYPVIVPSGNPPLSAVVFPATLFLVLIGLITYIVSWVYVNNRFFLTNESVIQEIQFSLFSHNEQTVSLLNIEDASYTQTGIMQMLFNYGSIRLSTEGDETTYRFNYVANPKKHIATLNNAVEAFKNGRPVAND